MSSSKLKILYIAGESRSGSTVLGRILGETPGFFFTGEILNIWRHYLIDNKVCACGLPSAQCTVWVNIFKTAFDMKVFDIHQMESWRYNSVRNRFAWKMLFPNNYKQLQSDLSEYLMNLEKLYYSVSQTTGATIIVDSSKRPTYAFLLSLIPTVEVYIVHLVRDVRGVAYSWRRKRVQQQTAIESIYMRQFSSLQSAYRWNISNLLTEMLLQRTPYFIRIRYEDFVQEPIQELSRIYSLLNLTEQETPIIEQDKVCLATNHAVWGNPSRFQTGLIKLRLDDEWQEKLPLHSRQIITFLTWLGLRRYQYL